MTKLINSLEIKVQNCHTLPLTIIGDFNLDVTYGANKVFCDMMRTRYIPVCYTANNYSTNYIRSDIFKLPIPEGIHHKLLSSDHSLICAVMDIIHGKLSTGLTR